MRVAALALLAALPPQDAPPRPGADVPFTPRTLAEAIDAGARWIVEHQLPNGSWGSHRSARPIEVFATPPGSRDAFRVATTALCVMALRSTPRPPEGTAEAIARALDYLLGHAAVKRVSALEHYNVWSFGYGLRALGEELLRDPEHPRADEIRAMCATLVEKLEKYQCLDGGWGYLSLSPPRTYRPSETSMSFTTATILIGLDRASRAGIDVPRDMVEKALRCLERCRTPNGSFTYGPLWNRAPLMGVNQPKGASCRNVACLEALALWRREIPERDFRKALEDLLVRHARFAELALRRPIPHSSWYQVSGYFYLYGQAYAALGLRRLPARDRERLAPILFQRVMRTRQPSGSFWDYPLYRYHEPYGTSYALLALTSLEPGG